MSLKSRKIQAALDAHATKCLEALNTKLGTAFALSVDWSCLPGDIENWNWDNERLEVCFYNSFFYPLETALAELLKDAMSAEAIREQVKTLRLEGGESGVKCAFKDGQLVYRHEMSVNEKELRYNEYFNRSAVSTVTQALESGLS